MDVPVFTAADLTARLESFRRPWHHNYLAMYSSLWSGLVTDPVLMTVPVDDHLVHRADGVFDVFKCVNGQAYCLRLHLDRLERSAAGLDLALPAEYDRIVDIIRAAVQVGGRRDVLVRTMISRGPGGFTTNPFECPASHLYVIISTLKAPPEKDYEDGIAIISAPVPVKPAIFAAIKSCDYLGNVLVKKVAVEAGLNFAVSWDENGFLAEGSTENIILVSPDQELILPEFDRVLRGVTLTRVLDLARTLVREGMLTDIRIRPIDQELARRCPEAMFTGTSMDVLPVTTWDGRPVGTGRPGPVARRLLALVREDVASNREVLTPLFD